MMSGENQVGTVGVEVYETNPLVGENAGAFEELQEDGPVLPTFATGAEQPSPTSPDGKKKRRRRKKSDVGEGGLEMEMMNKEEEAKQQPKTFLVVVLGAAGVGKTALAMQYCSNFFPRKYEPTVSEKYRKKVTVDMLDITIHILDTAGQEDYCTLPEEYLQDGDAFIIVYGADSMASFDKVDEFCSDLEENRDKGDEVPVVLCANRVDLDTKRVVTAEMGQQKMQEWHDRYASTDATEHDAKLSLVEYVECSAKDNLHVGLAFDVTIDALVKQLYDKQHRSNNAKDDNKNTNASWCGSTCSVS